MTETAETEIVQVLEDTLQLLDEVEQEERQVQEHRSRVLERVGGGGGGGGCGFHPGDRVEADYALEGTFYPAVVVESVSSDGENGDGDGDCRITVCYDDDGSSETLPRNRVRPSIPPTATQTSLGGPLSDEDAFGGTEHGDDSYLLTKYELQYDLAQLKEKAGDLQAASALYEEAADGAMAAGKMKTATQWSLKAAEIRAD